MRYGILATSLRALIPVGLLLTSLTASADGPTPAGGTPSASQLQAAHNLGKDMADTHFEQERFPHGGPPPKDLMRPKLDDYLKEHGSRLSAAEKEVFTEAYWSKYDRKSDSFMGGMTQIDPPSLMPPGASPTTVVSCKTATPGPGTLQLTDEKGKSYFVDVDANGNYSTTVPTSNFQPTKMTLRTGTVKAAWEHGSDGKTWRQVSGVTTGTSSPSTAQTQGAMAPTRGSATQQVAYFDECKQYAVVGSVGHESLPVARLETPWLRPVRFGVSLGANQRSRREPLLRLVDTALTPQDVQRLTDLGAKVGDLEHQMGELDKQLQNPNLSDNQKKDLNRQKDELNNSKGRNEGAARDEFPGDREAQRVFEKAKDARKKQRELEEAERKAAQDPNDKKVQRTVNRLRLELQDLQRGIGTLPPLAMNMPSPGTGGSATGALAQAPGASLAGASDLSLQASYTIKGTAKMGSGVAIPKGTFVTGVMLSRQETPEEFVESGDDSKLSFGGELGGPIVRDKLWFWGTNTANAAAPPLATINANGAYQYDYKVGLDYGLGKNLALGVEYKAAFSAGVNYGCVKQSFADLAAGKEMPTTAIEDRTQLIKGLSPRANLWQVDEAFVQNGLGHAQGWDPWESPDTTFTPRTWFSYKIAESDISKFNRIGSTYFDVIGSNFGINTAPAPAWKPENWPSAHPSGIPTARVSRKGGRP